MPLKKKAHWEWQNDANRWIRYAAKDSAKMEEAYQAERTVLRTTELSFNADFGSLYHYNFGTMTQLNTESRTKRDIRRVAVKAKAKAKAKGRAKAKAKALSKKRRAVDKDEDEDESDEDECESDASMDEDAECESEMVEDKELTKKNAKAFTMLTKPMNIGNAVWDGCEADLITAIDQGIDVLQQLLNDVVSIAESSKDTPVALASAPAASSAGSEGSIVTVAGLSGRSIDIALSPASTVSDLKSKVASWLDLLPCQFLLMQGVSRLADHEEVSVSGGALQAVVRNVPEEARALAVDLVCCARASKKAGLKLALDCVSPPAGLAGALHRLSKFAAKYLLRTAPVDPDLGMWAARILDGVHWDSLSGLGFYKGIHKDMIDKEGQRMGIDPPLLLLGCALRASDGGESAAAVFCQLCFGERWCAATVGVALMGPCGSSVPGVGSSLAAAFRHTIASGTEAAACDVLCACICAATVESHCSLPLALAGMAGAAALAWKEGGRPEPEVRAMAGALLAVLLDSLWPGRGKDRDKTTKAAEEVLLKDLVSAGLANPTTKKIVPAINAELQQSELCKSLGYGGIDDISCGDYKHEVGSENRPSSWPL